MKTRALILLSLAALSVAATSGCVWISEDDIARFNDRDGDGQDHNVDCDDGNKAIQGTTKYYPDVDGDGFGDMNAQATEACPSEAPQGHVTDNTDCNDNNPDALPGGVEVCDLQDIDEDCDGAADDADAEADGKVSWYRDGDGDGFGDEADGGVLACDPTGSQVDNNADCDDTRADVSPSGTEVCDPDNVDEDCNGFADDEAGSGLDPASRIQYYGDADSDGYGNPAVVGSLQCDTPGGEAPNNGDCNDADPAIHPAATEVCDALDVDENCNAMADDADPGTDISTMSLWYPDTDNDTYGDEFAAAVQACDPLPGEVSDNTDCDDGRDDVYPTAPEICDVGNVDEDCDGLSNDADSDAIQSDWWADNDGDGFGQLGPPATTACIGPANHAPQSGDCNDGDNAINPDAKEYHDGVDSDCDALATDFICGESYLRVGPAEAFTTIQSAVNAVDQLVYCDGDTIEVLPGTYNENLTIADRSPNVVGLVGPISTVIQGTGSGRVVSLDRTSARFEGFTVQGGVMAGDGGGIRVFYGDGAVLDNLVVTGNSAVNGGGIELRNPTDVTVSNSTIELNSTTTGDGGGIRVSSTGGQSAGQVLLTGLTVASNTAGDEGGGIRVVMDVVSGTNGLGVTIDQTVIDSNNAVTAGGLSADIVPSFVLRDLDIIDNVGAANHGGVQIKNAGVLVERVLLEGNQGVTVGAMQIGDYTDGVVTLRDVTAIDNILTQADGNGSALLLKGDESDGTVLERVEVARTVRTPGPFFSWGAGLSVEGKLDARNLLIYDEAAPSGLHLVEALSGVATTHAVTNATVVGNDNDGIMVAAAVATSVNLVNVISAHNGGYGVNQSLINAAVSSSDVFGNALGEFAGTNPIGSNGVISADPVFVNWSAFTSSSTWDLHLGGGSPCIDSGEASLLDADGSVSDMGHYGGPSAP